jgi:hypothetical protein
MVGRVDMWPLVGPTPMGPNRVVSYQLTGIRRWWPVVLCVAVGLVPSYGYRRPGDFAFLILVGIVAVATAAVAYVTIRRTVTLTPGALLFRTWNTTKVLAWSEIDSVVSNRKQLWINTATGTFILPLSINASAIGPANPGSAGLSADVWSWWFHCRGQDWAPALPTAWRPTLDAAGRVVIRGSRFAQMTPYGSFFGACIGVAAGSGAPGFGLIQWAIAVAALLAYHRWARVTIDRDTITVRGLTTGRQRVARSDIVGIGEKYLNLRHFPGQNPARLTILAKGRIIPLPGPVNYMHWLSYDADYYRKWQWLQDELVAPQQWVASDADAS